MLWFYITYAKPHVKYLEEQTSLTDILMSVGDIMRLLKKTKLGIDPSVPGLEVEDTKVCVDHRPALIILFCFFRFARPRLVRRLRNSVV